MHKHKINKMNKIILIIGFLVSINPLLLRAYDFEVEGMYFDVISMDNMTCAITYKEYKKGTDSYKGSFEIPTSVTYANRTFTVTRVGPSCFQNCTSLTDVYIPDNISIGDDAFLYCNNLKNVNIPTTLSSLGNGIFRWCKSLNQIVIPQNIIKIGRGCFSDSNINELIFEDCENPIELSSESDFDFTLFYDRDGTYSSTVCDLGGTFCGCKINNFYLGREIISNVKKISPFVGLLGFISEVKQLILGPSIKNFPLQTFGNIIIQGDQLSYEPITNFKMLSVLGTGDISIVSNTWQTNIKINKNIWGAGGWYEDYGSSSIKIENKDLQNVEILTSGKNIMNSESIFKNVKDAIFLEECNYLGSNLKNCQNLRRIELPESMDTIAYNAFINTSSLNEILCRSFLPPIFNGDPGFSNKIYINSVLYVPEESVDLYKTAPYWKNFWNILPIDSYDNISDIAVNTDGHFKIFSINGILLNIADSIGEIGALPSGVYIISNGNSSYKIVK